jgi:hypothetical protein
VSTPTTDELGGLECEQTSAEEIDLEGWLADIIGEDVVQHVLRFHTP